MSLMRERGYPQNNYAGSLRTKLNDNDKILLIGSIIAAVATKKAFVICCSLLFYPIFHSTKLDLEITINPISFSFE